MSAESVMIQRSWRAADARLDDEPKVITDEPDEDEPKQVVADPTMVVADYDCNGDGEPDCGKWNYQMSMCHNQYYCGLRYKFGDWTLGHSCRCRRCHTKDLLGTAFSDTKLQHPWAFNALSWGTFRSWADHLDTCSPWIMPKSDQDLQNALAYAAEQGYRVRISGAAHSSGGLVTDGRDKNVFVISLAEYTAPGEWEFGIRPMPDGSKRATVNAGWTQAHLFAKIRPLGFFVPAQTMGYFFQIGGVVANSVHGGAYDRGFIHSYVTRLRVMGHDGRIRVIDEEEELRYWRCSYGLLGIILGVEFQLEYRVELQMYTITKKMPSWSEKELWRFIKRDAEADLPAEVGKVGGNSTRQAFSGEFFLDFLNDEHLPTMMGYVQKTNRSVDISFEGELGIPAGVHGSYYELLTKSIKHDWHGRMTWGQAARREGAPPVEVASIDVNDLLRRLRALGLAKQLSMAVMRHIPGFVKSQSDKVNDGFWETEAPATISAAYFVPPENIFAAMDKLKQVQFESLGSKEFVWNLPGEFRFVHIRDMAVLQPVEAGRWVTMQMLSFEDLAKHDQAWKRPFKQMEDYLVDKLGAKPHMGKLWGFGATEDGTIEPFSDQFSCRLFSDKAKAKFMAYRREQDPKDMFFSGLGVKLMRPCRK